MNQYEVKIVESKSDNKKFIDFPSKIYTRDELSQNKKVEVQILTGKHPLSHYFDALGFIVMLHKEVVARCIVTLYNEDDSAYVGFFESLNDKEAVEVLFNSVKKYALAHGKLRLIGPVDSSFWIKYRFRTKKFADYTLEPINKQYYLELWQSIGFEVYEEYYSNHLRVPTELDSNPKYQKRLSRCLGQGYEIRNTRKETFNTDLKNIYKLLVKVYSRFPIFKYIDEKEFLKLYKNIRYILDYKMVFLAYKDSELLGFMVCVPNYKKGNIIQNLLGKHKEYVMMYLGVDNRHPGLGGAFAELCRKSLAEQNCSCISALMHKGNVSSTFYKELSIGTSEYVLLRKELIN